MAKSKRPAATDDNGVSNKHPRESATRAHERGIRFVKFLTAAVTPFHAAHYGSQVLEEAGFTRLQENETWSGKLAAGGKYFYTRCDSTLVAFAVGKKYAAGGGFKIVGAHTDSPALKAKPLTLHGSGAAEGLTQVSVVTYGGGLWHTWFDRDLGIGGLVLSRDPTGGVQKHITAISQPILRVPTLCIHLQTAEERSTFAPNKESHLAPVLCMAAKRQLESTGGDGAGGKSRGAESDQPVGPSFAAKQESELMRLLSESIGKDPKDIVSFDLTLFDVQAPSLGGTHQEFVLGGRLDNLASCFVCLEALVDAAADMDANDGDVSCIALFDHEEVGSDSVQGAGGPVMEEALNRVAEAFGAPAESEVAKIGLRKSFIVSLDNAHAVHPNYRVRADRPRVALRPCADLFSFCACCARPRH